MKGAWLLAAAALVACSSDDPKPGAGAGGSSGAPAPAPPVVVPPPPPGAVDGTDAAVFVRARVEGDAVIAELVTRSTPALSGAALRLAFPAWLRFDRRDPDAGWSAESVHHTKLSDRSEVILADTRLGKGIAHPAPASGESTVLTTVYFTRIGPPAAGSLTLVAPRSELRDAEGKVVPAAFYAQALGD